MVVRKKFQRGIGGDNRYVAPPPTIYAQICLCGVNRMTDLWCEPYDRPRSISFPFRRCPSCHSLLRFTRNIIIIICSANNGRIRRVHPTRRDDSVVLNCPKSPADNNKYLFVTFRFFLFYFGRVCTTDGY